MKGLTAIISCALLIGLCSTADAQALVGTGSLASESLVRTRRID